MIENLMIICEKAVGYQEGKNNDTIYGKWFGLNNQPWCAMSASKMYFDAGMIKAVAGRAKGYASCAEWLKWASNNKMLVPIGEAKAGDIVFFQFDDDADPDHVGICKGNNRALKFLKVYEGNTSNGIAGSQANGDGYYLRKRSYATIMAVARPKEIK